MLISVLTPTNNPSYLGEAYRYLKRQTYTDWEWIIMPNGNVSIPDFNDDRVKVFNDLQSLNGATIGFLKRHCAEKASGQIMVELDHDDFLHHECLEKTHYFLGQADFHFFYSGFAEFHEKNMAPNIYGENWGWNYFDYQYDGNQYKCPILHPPIPQFMLKITHGPNHVRAWRSKDYWEVGGHDATLEVGDDYDLYNKFYIAGKKFHYTNDCLYFYRWQRNGTNNTNLKNQKIQENVGKLYHKFFTPAALRWSKDNNLRCLDLGAAHAKASGFEGVDVVQRPGVDVVADLNQKWPFEDSSVGVIRAYDFIEHLNDKVHTWNEIWRVLAPGGFIFVEVPSSDGRGAFQDPTHVSFYNLNSSWYLYMDNYKNYVSGANWAFWPLRVEDHYPSQFHIDNKIPYTRMHLVCLKNGIHLPQPYPHMKIPK